MSRENQYTIEEWERQLRTAAHKRDVTLERSANIMGWAVINAAGDQIGIVGLKELVVRKNPAAVLDTVLGLTVKPEAGE